MSKEEKDDQQLMEIITRNMGIIVRISGFYAHTRHDREDLVNDIVYELLKSYGSFGGNSSVSTWIYRVALNTSMNYSRKRRRDSVVNFGAQEKELDRQDRAVSVEGPFPVETSVRIYRPAGRAGQGHHDALPGRTIPRGNIPGAGYLEKQCRDQNIPHKATTQKANQSVKLWKWID